MQFNNLNGLNGGIQQELLQQQMQQQQAIFGNFPLRFSIIDISSFLNPEVTFHDIFDIPI